MALFGHFARVVRLACCSLPKVLPKINVLPFPNVASRIRCFSAVSGNSIQRTVISEKTPQHLFLVIRRNLSDEERRTRTGLFYLLAVIIFMTGGTYSSVPLYRMICQVTGIGGEVQQGHDDTAVEQMAPRKERQIKVRFNADTASSMMWNFRPQQPELKLVPGETALAFYRAKNPTDRPIVGIATYNVVPFEAGLYFNKVQCFCFEEQRLNPHEEIDMPVFFYIDPAFCDDPGMEKVDMLTLSYTFFEAKEGLNLTVPDYFKK